MKSVLKRRPSKRFVLGESGEDGAWDPTQEVQITETPNIPTISEPIAQDNLEKVEIIRNGEDPETHTKYLRVTTGSIK